jgi:carboxypeptidase family protein
VVVWNRAVGTLALLLLLSGCSGDAKPRVEATTSASPSAGLGSIEGEVLDDEQRPVVGAEVGLLTKPQLTTTDELGKFIFNDLEPGGYDVAVGMLGYESAVQRVTVASDEVATVAVQLKPYEIPKQAIVRTVSFNGFLQCSYNPYYFVNPCREALGENVDHFKVELDPALEFKQLLLELVWVPTTAASGQELELDFCLPPDDASSAATGCMVSDLSGEFYAYDSGGSPVVINLTAEEMPIADHKIYEAWVGNGILSPTPSVQQSFTLFATACYVAECPKGTTALAPL